MKRSPIVAAVAAFALCAGIAALVAPARADIIVYGFAGLRGTASDCAWFDDNINDRSEAALDRQVAMLYNRVALPPGEPVTITGTATNQQGSQLVQFHLFNTTICTGAESVNPPPLPSPGP